MNRTAIAFAFAAGAAFGGPAVAADLIVLESNVASLAPGSVVPASRAVQLDGGARLVMIAADGTTRAVSGPYSGPLGRAGADAPGIIERLTGQRDGSNHVVGAIRAPAWDQEQ